MSRHVGALYIHHRRSKHVIFSLDLLVQEMEIENDAKTNGNPTEWCSLFWHRSNVMISLHIIMLVGDITTISCRTWWRYQMHLCLFIEYAVTIGFCNQHIIPFTVCSLIKNTRIDLAPLTHLCPNYRHLYPNLDGIIIFTYFF